MALRYRRSELSKKISDELPRGKLRGIKPYRFRIALQVIRVIRACPVAPGDGTGVICEICGPDPVNPV